LHNDEGINFIGGAICKLLKINALHLAFPTLTGLIPLKHYWINISQYLRKKTCPERGVKHPLVKRKLIPKGLGKMMFEAGCGLASNHDWS